MSAKLLSGKEVASALDAGTAERVEKLKAKGVEPTLAILRVGESADDVSYERAAAKRAQKVGLEVRRVMLAEDASQKGLMEAVRSLDADAGVHGVLLLRPLPARLDEESACAELDCDKDVDGITSGSLAGLFLHDGTGFSPCTARSCLEILDYYGVSLSGKRAVVVGRSLVVGKPVALMLLDRDATVTIAHSRTEDLASITRGADVVISCVGKAGLLGPGHFSEGQVVVDVGVNFDQDGKLVGDVQTEAVSQIVSAITPVPGGIGSVTTSVLCRHAAEAAARLEGVEL